MRLFCLLLAAAIPAAAAGDEFLHSLYDKLHDSPAQRRFRELAPVPVGVVFLPWDGATEADIRAHYRLMKKLGFNNLKQVMGNPQWSEERLLEIALEEDLIPFWYGEGGWEPITPELLEKLGIPKNLPKHEVRKHPKMRAYQKEVLRKGITTGNSAIGAHEASEAKAGFRFQPDPYLRDHDVPHFQQWLRTNYSNPAALSKAWNQSEVGIDRTPVQSWEDVDRLVAEMAKDAPSYRNYGREYGRVRDVLRYKSDYHTAEVRSRLEAQRRANGNPWAPTRTGGEMGLFLPFAWRATKMEDLAETQKEIGSFYPSIHMAWHYGEVNYEVARPVYMQAAFAADLFKGGWAATWESTGGPQQLTGAKGWDYAEGSTTPGFTISGGTMTQLLLSYFAAGLKGVGLWTWNFRRAGWEGGEYALLDRNWQPGERAVRAGQISQAAERYRDELWAAHKEPVVGVLVNWDNDAMWAAVSVRGRDHFRHYPMRARVGVSRALINGNIPFEYVTLDDLRAGLAARYKVICLPGQLALSTEVLGLLDRYVRESGGRVVLDAPGAAYDERGLVLSTAQDSPFERLFGASISDLQYSNNVPRRIEDIRLQGFVHEVEPTRAEVRARFDTGEPAVTEHRIGKGSAVILAWDASFSLFAPGQTRLEELLRRWTVGHLSLPYSCDEAIVYRISAPAADHYFFINDAPARSARLAFRNGSYRQAMDAVTGERIDLQRPIPLEAFGGRWIRAEK